MQEPKEQSSMASSGPFSMENQAAAVGQCCAADESITGRFDISQNLWILCQLLEYPRQFDILIGRSSQCGVHIVA